MSTDASSRPAVPYQQYAETPGYIRHGSDYDVLSILVCRIKTWKAKGNNWFDIPADDSCLIIRECESIEINDSYKELVGKAVIKFPRGTIVEKRKGSIDNVVVDSGNSDGKVASSSVTKATQDGDCMAYYTQTVNEKKASDKVKTKRSVVSVDGTQVDVGMTQINQHTDEKELLNPNDFVIGNRIEIYLGYAYSEDEFKKMQSDTNKVPVNMEMAFTGFITGCSVTTPLEIECKNMAYVLTTVNVPDITIKSRLSIKDFLSENGTYNVLKNTGLKLSPMNGNYDVEVLPSHISSSLTIADVLSNWNKSGVTTFMENNNDGTSSLRVGKTYYSGKGSMNMPVGNKDYITYTDNQKYIIVQFDWDVAEDKLGLVNTDKKYLAVKAKALNQEGKAFYLTIRKTDTASEDWAVSDNEDASSWSIVNEREQRKKRGRKKKDGTRGAAPKGETYEKNLQNKADMSKFMVVEYNRLTEKMTRAQLVKEAKEYWMRYVPNGISGSLTVFGDLPIKPASIIGLIDPRQPQKNGYYIVEAVNTDFGAKGYRKELTIPYKIASFKDYPTYYI